MTPRAIIPIDALINGIASRIPRSNTGVPPTRDQLAEVAASIANDFRPERIVLFGSHAYGEPTLDSDVDLMVIMDTPLSPPEQAVRIRQSIDLRPSFPLDILVRKPQQIQSGLQDGDFFIQEVMNRGAVLYEAGDPSLG